MSPLDVYLLVGMVVMVVEPWWDLVIVLLGMVLGVRGKGIGEW